MLAAHPLTQCFPLQKTAVAVAYVKAGSGLLKLNGEHHLSLRATQQPFLNSQDRIVQQRASLPLMVDRSHSTEYISRSRAVETVSSVRPRLELQT